jgi:hypothetical protein
MCRRSDILPKASKKGQPLSILDTTFSILGNVLGFAKVRVWVKYLLLLFLAIIAWYVNHY